MNETYYRVSPSRVTEKVIVPGCGIEHRCTLYTISEDGRQDEFEVASFDPVEVEVIRALWKLDPKLIYLIQSCVAPVITGPDLDDEDSAREASEAARDQYEKENP